jgi:hypothetical protein
MALYVLFATDSGLVRSLASRTYKTKDEFVAALTAKLDAIHGSALDYTGESHLGSLLVGDNENGGSNLLRNPTGIHRAIKALDDGYGGGACPAAGNDSASVWKAVLASPIANVVNPA